MKYYFWTKFKQIIIYIKIINFSEKNNCNFIMIYVM